MAKRRSLLAVGDPDGLGRADPGSCVKPGALTGRLPARRTPRPTHRPGGRRSPFSVRPSSRFSVPSSGVGTVRRCLSRIVRVQNSRQPSVFCHMRHGAVETHERARCCGSESWVAGWSDVRECPPYAGCVRPRVGARAASGCHGAPQVLDARFQPTPSRSRGATSGSPQLGGWHEGRVPSRGAPAPGDPAPNGRARPRRRRRTSRTRPNSWIRPSTVKRHLADLRARSGLTTDH